MAKINSYEALFVAGLHVTNFINVIPRKCYGKVVEFILFCVLESSVCRCTYFTLRKFICYLIMGTMEADEYDTMINN